jgi:NAD(P)-dependent dehydrogenase (short-subunit alcohol dehydrogenase family)
MKLLLEGRTAFITGAAGGIGLAVAQAYQQHGCNVVISDIDKAGLDRALATLDAARAAAVVLNVASEVDTEAALEATLARFGGVDLVVANAGVLVLKPALDISADEFRRALDVNLTGAFLTAKIFAGHMRDQGRRGGVIFTASLFGVRGGAENAAYSASKFGIVGLTQCLAADLAPSGIRVNSVCPGQIDTEMSRRLLVDRAALRKMDPGEIRRAMERRIPLGAYGTPEEVAGAYVYLASDLASYVTGQSVIVDGGWQVG